MLKNNSSVSWKPAAVWRYIFSFYAAEQRQHILEISCRTTSTYSSIMMQNNGSVSWKSAAVWPVHTHLLCWKITAAYPGNQLPYDRYIFSFYAGKYRQHILEISCRMTSTYSSIMLGNNSTVSWKSAAIWLVHIQLLYWKTTTAYSGNQLPHDQ